MSSDPVSPWLEARSLPPATALAERYVRVGARFAEQLKTTHTRSFAVASVNARFGREQLTADIPNLAVDKLADLDARMVETQAKGARARGGRDRVGASARAR